MMIIFKDFKFHKIIIICSIFILIYYYINKNKKTCKKNIEKMTVISDKLIEMELKNFYTSDVFLKIMNNISNKIKSNGLQIKGDLLVTGNINSTGEISNNNYSFSKTNNSINNNQEKISNTKIQKGLNYETKIREIERKIKQELEEKKKLEEEQKKIEESRCNKNPQYLLGNKTCNHWSWMDERWQQTYLLPNYYITGTVLPAHDCWYAPTSQCVSRECMKSPNPGAACLKRFWPHMNNRRYRRFRR